MAKTQGIWFSIPREAHLARREAEGRVPGQGTHTHTALYLPIVPGKPRLAVWRRDTRKGARAKHDKSADHLLN